MKIQLLNKTPDFLRTIWCAGRTCHSEDTPQELFAMVMDQAAMVKLVRYLIGQRHLSTLEHCSMTFGVAGVSRTLLAQYSRHRIGVSLSVQSQRYVSEKSSRTGGCFDFVEPPSVAATPERHRAYLEAMEAAQGAYDSLIALGVAMEDARFVLPGGICTNFTTTLNLRSLMDLYEKRVLVKGAQWEIRQMIQEMAALVVEAEPWLAPFFPSGEEGAR